MKLVPFFITRKNRKNLEVSCLYVFLAHGGKAVWKTEENKITEKEILEEYCLPNGFEVEKIWIEEKENIAFIQISSSSNLNDFYSWEESAKHPQKPECWRKFYFFKDCYQSDWFYPQDIHEAEVQDLGNIGKVFDHLIQVYAV